jgi:acetylornithine deacetylase/succinyl-diaminopimelate desuccinylase-like protein
VVHGGVKTNVIPDVVDVEVDIRVLPGEDDADVNAHLRAALGELADEVEVSPLQQGVATRSPIDNPLWAAMQRAAARFYPDATLLPTMTVGGTDARFYRDHGAIAYGFGLFSPGVTYESFRSRFHGHNERIDTESLRMSTEIWLQLVAEVLG